MPPDGPSRRATCRPEVCVLGASLSRALFGYRNAVGAAVRFQGEWHHVVGVLADRTTDTRGTSTLAARDLNQAVLLPISSLLARLPGLDPEQPIDELWIGLREGERVVEVGRIAEATLHGDRRGPVAADVVVPRELLQQRYRTQRTFGIVVVSIAVGRGFGIYPAVRAALLDPIDALRYE